MYLTSDSVEPPADPVNYMFALLGVLGPDVQQLTNHAVDRGATLTLIDFLPGDTDRSWFTIFQASSASPAPCDGVNDTTCRHHLDGSATFSARAPHGPATIGPAPSATWVGEADHIDLALPILGDATASVRLQGTKVSGDVTSSGFKQVSLTGAITVDDWNDHVIPALQTNLTTLIATDCADLATPPACGCADSSTGQVLLNTFDADADCKVTTDEVSSNFLLQVISPNVDLDGTPALSVTVGFDAVPAKVDLQP